jgi:hypothetical protein
MNEEFKTQEFKVVDIITPSRVVLSCGTDQGVAIGDSFQVYKHGKMVTDPDTGADIEALEIPRGPGRVIYVQRKLCTIESTSMTYRTVEKKPENPYLKAIGLLATPSFAQTIETERISVRVPFINVEIGDRARFTGAEK